MPCRAHEVKKPIFGILWGAVDKRQFFLVPGVGTGHMRFKSSCFNNKDVWGT